MWSSPARPAAPPRVAATPAGRTGLVLDTPIRASNNLLEVNESSFSLLFAECVRHAQSMSDSIEDLETRLSDLGESVGRRFLDLVVQRERPEKRETRVVAALQFATSTCWTSIYGRNADALERSTEAANTYLIREREPLPLKFASVPKDLGRLNLAAFNAGIFKGLLDGQGFPCKVTAHETTVKGGGVATVYVVEFDRSVAVREAKLAASGGA